MENAADFQPGFRLSEIDVGVLMLGILLSVLLARFDESFAVALLFLLAHFFLFCNVLRMSRPLELVWALLFVLLAASTIRTGYPSWRYNFSAMLVVTASITAVQILRPSYHGVFWRRFNPNLPQWWAANKKNQA